MKVYQLTLNKKIMFEGAEKSCYLTLQRMQSNSAMWAMKYEGWAINEMTCTDAEAKEILKNDMYNDVECEIIEERKGLSRWIKVRVLETGEIMNGNINAMCYETLDKGSKVTVTRHFLTFI